MDNEIDMQSGKTMLKIPVLLKETQGIERKYEPVSFGVPFKKGQVFDLADLGIYDGKTSLPVDSDATAFWSDKSIKWALFNSQVNLLANEKKSLIVANKSLTATDSIEVPKGILITEHDHSVCINTGTTEFVIEEKYSIPLPISLMDDDDNSKVEQFEILLKDQTNCHLRPIVSNRRIEASANGLKIDVVLEGIFLDKNKSKQDESDTAIKFLTRSSFYFGKSTVKFQITISNPNAAVHPGGIWDLGGEGSFNFNDLSVEIPLPKSAKFSYKERADSNWQIADSQQFSFFQCSSGGDYWNSPNHVNSKGKVPIKFKGYRILNANDEPIIGDRASPLIAVTDDKLNFSVQIKNFWQEFPKALSVNDATLRLSLFPKEFEDSYELQGGEQKTHSVYFDFSDDKDALLWSANPVEISFSPDYIKSTNAINWLSSDIENNPLTQLIVKKGLQGKHNFFAKRETIDEFGWRNFGEVYADHEGLGHKGNTPLISHYNNQYDPLYGFARMFLQSGESRWFELMNDLASHIVDIDIYNTDQDRYEYNGGLFWHTDHYLTAETCSHRTFSKHHTAAYQDHKGGGGPADEHCYTAGLTAHYFLTGCVQSKNTVIQLAQWFINLQEGQGLLLARIFQAKKKDLVDFKRVLKGERLAKIKYPFTRGTGNYISTLLDAYSLTEERHYLELVESVIPQAIHPMEDVSLRHLEDKEYNWSYIIFLQSLTKYLELKSGMGEYNDNFYYARDSLLNLTDWMLEHEYPILEKPEILEFPNMAWVAQDIRKAQLFFISSQYTDKSNAYIEKAHYFLDYVMQKLQNHSESDYARILSVLMQNQGPEDFFPLTDIDKNKLHQINTISYGKAPQISLFGVISELGIDLLKNLMKFSLSKEKAWLYNRIG